MSNALVGETSKSKIYGEVGFFFNEKNPKPSNPDALGAVIKSVRRKGKRDVSGLPTG